ncbi:hypothetical protein EDD16DRAFT_126792 [Pisolithus croceorrhizus]|nr:hypothetical protein F5141DRAFT_122208 [Pisolithus sp. B1]KAI6128381.1 hypothetical protein EDD16DRAFT_126792 [Pisolithus croceorrhizus]KAI6156439.1 hypothetical protein EDD17DRAFT_1025955 [Pisolithus thermaeus]
MLVLRSVLFFSFFLFFPLVSFPSSPSRPTFGSADIPCPVDVGGRCSGAERVVPEMRGCKIAPSTSSPKVIVRGQSSPADGRLRSLPSPSTVLTPGLNWHSALNDKGREKVTRGVRLSRR